VVAVRFLIVMVICGPLAAMTPARADDALLDRWYAALFDADREAISELLSDNATIRLQDLGVTQTKTEFIAALDEWEEIVQTANFAWQIDAEAAQDPNQATALVCYQFPDNELMIREVFSFDGGRITGSVQSTVSDSCEEF
jgi:hypothetical protein